MVQTASLPVKIMTGPPPYGHGRQTVVTTAACGPVERHAICLYEPVMGKHIFFLSLLAALQAWPLPVAAEVATGKGNIAVLTQSGNYAGAIQRIHTELAHKPLTESKRFTLLQSLAVTREKQAMAAGFHVDTKAAIQAYKVLHREFPRQFDEAALLWKTAWLSWQRQDMDQADAAAQTLLSDHPRSPEADKAALLHARFLLKNGRYPAARSILLRYFGLNTNISSHEQREGLAWIAVIDEAEGAKRQAYHVMQKLMRQDPSVIEGDAAIYAGYIRLLDRFSTRRKVLLHAQAFVRRYISTSEAPAVRLLLADTLVRVGQPEKAKQLYGMLASRYRSLSVGKKAFMRELMLTTGRQPDRLNATLKLLATMARENQLSDIEAESWLDQARLLAGAGKQRASVKGQAPGAVLQPDIQNPTSKSMSGNRQERALENYALVATSEQPAWTSIARAEGQTLLSKRLRKWLQGKSWLQAVLLWRRFPQLRPEGDQRLVFNVAQAYMQLMDFSDADTLLGQLYRRSMNTVWGQRIMLEKARLWAERGDKDAVDKIMRWLSRHEQTLYRPDMLLIAANVQVGNGRASVASQTLAGINPADLTPVLDRTYWLTRASISRRLRHWHDAAKAWRHLAADSAGDEKWRALYGEADALMQGMDYPGVQNVLTQIPSAARNATWHFYLGLSAYRAGQWMLAKTQLTLLRDGKAKTPAYALLARYMLDVHKIGELEGHLP